MEKLTKFLEKYLNPIAVKFSNNRYLMAIRDAFLISLPFTIFASLFTALVNIPFLSQIFGDEKVGAFKTLIAPTFSLTLGVISFIIAAAVGYSLSKRYEVNPIYGAIVSLVSFIMITPTSITIENGQVIADILPLSEIGAVGMFSAIIIAIIVTEIYRLAIHKNWTIKMPSSVPKLVSDSFFSFIPVGLALLSAFIIRVGFSYTQFETVNNFIYKVIQMPLTSLGSSLLATVIVGILVNLFWFFGLHGHVIIASIMVPIWNTLSFENLSAFQSGNELPNIINGQFADFFVLSGSYISVPILICILIFLRKRSGVKELGKVALIPGIFGVYEPLIFGLPIMLNPILFIPLILTPVITTLISYFAMASGLVAITTGVALPYTMPMLLSGMMVTNSISGAILQFVLLAILTVMWYIFLNIATKNNESEDMCNG